MYHRLGGRDLAVFAPCIEVLADKLRAAVDTDHGRKEGCGFPPVSQALG